MSNDLTATISTKLNGTLGSLDQTQRKLLGLRDTLLAVNRAGKDTAPVLGKALAETGRRAEQATRAAQSGARQQSRVKPPGASPTQTGRGNPPPKDKSPDDGLSGASVGRGIGQAIGERGGTFGGLAKRTLDVSGLSGGYARLAVGLGLVAVAYRALEMVGAAALDRTQKQLEYERRLADVRTAAAASSASHADRGRASADAERPVVAAGMERERDEVAREFDPTTANQAVAQALRIGKNRQGATQALRIARDLARTGAFTMDEALSELGQTKVRPNANNAQLLTKRIYRDRTGGDLMVDGEAATQRLRSNKLQQAVLSRRDEELGIYREDQRHAIADGDSSAKVALAEARDPLAAAQIAAFNKMSGELTELKRLAAEEGFLVRWKNDITSVDGSMETQLRRRQQAVAAAWVDPSTKP